jgi:hypothetical protein
MRIEPPCRYEVSRATGSWFPEKEGVFLVGLKRKFPVSLQLTDGSLVPECFHSFTDDFRTADDYIRRVNNFSSYYSTTGSRV